MPILTAIEPPGSSAPVFVSGDIPENQLYLPFHDVHASEPPDNETTNVPVVRLDLDIIPDTIASKLAVSFLGHVLFLKSQVPFPVVQLARIPEPKNGRAKRRRQEFLDVFDTLSSHLDTTFTALSTALALSGTPADSPASNDQNAPPPTNPATGPSRESGLVYIAFAFGPNIITSKSRIILALDGFQFKVWGERDDFVQNQPTPPRPDLDAKEEQAAEEELENDATASEAGSVTESMISFDNDYDRYVPSPTFSSSEDGDSVPPSDPDSVITPLHNEPLPRSPRPPLFPLPISTGPPAFDSSSEDESEEEDAPPPSSSQMPPPPAATFASNTEERRTLYSADRLLSRTLALADAEGYSLSADMDATQTHVLLRAPRRFAHPAWIPRQNVTATMDESLKTFLEHTHTGVEVDVRASDRVNGFKSRKLKRLEGVWVKARGPTPADEAEERGEVVALDEPQGNEMDEMIWWSWDGKLNGLEDW